MWTREVVVGADGSAASLNAVRWAAREADRREVPLRVVLAYARRASGGVQLQWARDGAAEADAARAVTHAQATAPGIEVRHDIVIGSAVPVLLTAAARADLVVVGNRGRRRAGNLLIGSVGQAVTVHAPCPAVVVRGRPDAVAGPVVVGVDGSTSSLETLGLAYEEAAGRATELIAVLASAAPAELWATEALARARVAEDETALEDWLAPWQEKYPQVPARPLVVCAGAATTLVELSRNAQLVAVGSRGHGGVAGTLIGSVGVHLLRHAGCPVLVNRHWPISIR